MADSTVITEEVESTSESMVNTAARDKETPTLPEQVSQETDESDLPPETPDVGDQFEEIKTDEVNSNTSADDPVESESVADSIVKTEEVESTGESTVNTVATDEETPTLPGQVSQEIGEGDVPPEIPVASGDQVEEVDKVNSIRNCSN